MVEVPETMKWRIGYVVYWQVKLQLQARVLESAHEMRGLSKLDIPMLFEVQVGLKVSEQISKDVP